MSAPSSCDCGCPLVENSGSFYVGLCKGNSTWIVDMKRNSLLELILIRAAPSLYPQVSLYRNSNTVGFQYHMIFLRVCFGEAHPVPSLRSP